MSDPRFRGSAPGGDSEALAQRLLDRPVAVRLGGEVSWARQILAICLVDLLARSIPQLAVIVAGDLMAHPLLPPGAATLAERLEDARRHALLEPQDALGEPSVTIVVGTEGAGDVYVDGDGWLSYLGETPGKLAGADESNPIGPLIAACRGASQVIQRLLGDLLPSTTQVTESYWSALALGAVDGPAADNPELSDPELEAWLMGAGSIGGASAYALARVPGLRGLLVVCDRDSFEERNSRKALLARRDAIEASARKIDAVVSEIEHVELDVAPHGLTLAERVAELPADHPLPLVMCAVDSIEARRELADHMPLDVLNAACGDVHISVSGHRTDDGPCVYCLYVGRVLDAETTRLKVLERATGLPRDFIRTYRAQRTPLDLRVLRQVAQHRGAPVGSLDHRVGMTLDELFEADLRYGEVKLAGDGDEPGSLFQLTFVPALAGFLLASEALKFTDDGLRAHRLGPHHAQRCNEYTETLLHVPDGLLTSAPRWETNECLCRSLRRLRLMRERYGLQ